MLVLALFVAAACVSLVSLQLGNGYVARKAHTSQVLDSLVIALSEASGVFQVLRQEDGSQGRSRLFSDARRQNRALVEAYDGLEKIRQTQGFSPDAVELFANPSVDLIGMLADLLLISGKIVDPGTSRLQVDRLTSAGSQLSKRLLIVLVRLRELEREDRVLAERRLHTMLSMALAISIVAVIVAIRFVLWPMERFVLEAQHQLETARIEAEHARRRFDTLADNMPGALFEWREKPDGTHALDYFSAKFPDLFGSTAVEIRTEGKALSTHFLPEDRDAFTRKFVECAANQSAFEEQARVVHPDKGLRWIMVSSLPVPQPDGSQIWYGSVMDITDRVESEFRASEAAEDLKRSLERLTLVTEIAPVGLYELRRTGDGEFDFPYVSGRFAEFAGIRATEIQENPSNLLPVVASEDRSELVNSIRRSASDLEHWRMRFRVIRPESGVLWLSGTAIPRLEENGSVVWTGAVLDVTPDAMREDALRNAHRLAEQMRADNEKQALHDGLTGLPNRRYYDRAIAERLNQARSQGGEDCTLIRLDLDHFKNVNDTLGHEAGDMVLVRVSEVLRDSIRSSDFAARIGGDEYSILLSQGTTRDDASALVARIQEKLAEPLAYHGRQCRFGASFGIAHVDDLAEAGADIQMFADAALYQAKERGRNCLKFFTPALHQSLIEERRLSVEIHEAIDGDQFVPFFQPQVSARDGRLVGVEVLLRWLHPTHGLILPGDFLKVAEQLHLVSDIDRIMMEKSRKVLARWQAQGLTIPKISFNVSSGRMNDPGIVMLAREMAGMETQVTFELLESILVEEENELFHVHLDAIRRAGIDIEIDDFGSGHASIIGLTEISPSALKIDKRLIAPVTPCSRALSLVGAIVEIAETLGIKTVAEGVENGAQASLLRDIGCTVLQGYHFSRPLSEEQFLAYAHLPERKSA